jgi:hypothetical protein
MPVDYWNCSGISKNRYLPPVSIEQTAIRKTGNDSDPQGLLHPLPVRRRQAGRRPVAGKITRLCLSLA